MSNKTQLEMDAIALSSDKNWARELVKYGDLRSWVEQAVRENPAETEASAIVAIVREMVVDAEAALPED